MSMNKKNTNLYHSADGLVSVVGETNSCWIHNNYIFNDGYLYGWSLDLEDGWNGMRGTILENNIIRKYFTLRIQFFFWFNTKAFWFNNYIIYI